MTLPQAKRALVRAHCQIGLVFHRAYRGKKAGALAHEHWPYKNMHNRVLGTAPVAGVGAPDSTIGTPNVVRISVALGK